MRSVPRCLQLLLLWLGIGFLPRGAEAEEPRLAAGLQPFVEKGSLAGAVVLVATPEKVLGIEAVGYSDIASKTPLKTDALFWIASQSKPMTATALMMLVDEGKVALDDPVEKYLPESRKPMMVADRGANLVSIKKAEKPITVRHLLSHTSGLVGRSPLERELDMLPLSAGVASYAKEMLNFEPGTKYEYCNPGINTVGRIVEVVSGMPYETFMQQRLFTPLGMTDTTFWPTEEQVKRLAKSYKPASDKKTLEEIPITQLTYPLTDRKLAHPAPPAASFSTAADVATFCRMILNGGTLDGKRYVSEASVRAMTSTQTGDLLNKGKGENGYGLGWSTSRKAREGVVIPSHCGHGGAYATNMGIDPERKIITVFMVQHAGYPGSDGEKIGKAYQAGAEGFVKAQAKRAE